MDYKSDLVGFGQFIRERRKELNLTQEGLGNRLGWAQERVSVLENGKYGLPSLPQLCRLADVLSLPLETILRNAGFEHDPQSAHEAEEATGRQQLDGLNDRMVILRNQMHSVEENLHRVEREMVKAETLQASIRERRQRMALLLAPYSNMRSLSRDA